ncbi:imelysin family protein [Mesorhizobium sp. SP-1A]|uniref:imelysin family protein n=1 Tax=Mesorhizobium sp. SP-1A TaxID=3077840 RepID=UPI0028F6D9A0|nr:imelysin family protein [Mesorhizobium sp. SP-1A]
MPKRLLLMLALPLSLAAGSPPASADVKASDVIGRAVDGFVRPAYENLRDHAAATAGAMKTLCDVPSKEHLDAARNQFSGLVDAWSTAEIIRFGPITEKNRLERMLYWPDRKGIGLRQVQAALAAKDPAIADPAGIAGKSVAMQGLGALEFVLYGTGADTLEVADDPYRCVYGRAVAGNIEQISANVSQEWNKPDGFAATWEKPGPGNAVYRDGSEAATELVGMFIDGLDQIRDVRLKGFLGRDAETDKPRLAVYWRSGKTADSLAANLAAMDDLLQVSRLEEALPQDSRWIAQSIHIQLANGVAAAKAASGPIDAVLDDPKRRERLEHFLLITSSLSNLFGTRMTAAFGLTAGFSSLDGD